MRRIVKTPTFAQPTHTFQKCITDGINGYLCKQGSGMKKIKAFYLRQQDGDYIVNNAFDYVNEHYQEKLFLSKLFGVTICLVKIIKLEVR